MNHLSMHEQLQHELGFIPGALAVMGKWEPFLRSAHCLREVTARAAAALALAEALASEGSSPFLLAVEGHLRRQVRPGCYTCAEVLSQLGAPKHTICCWPAANQTGPEVRALDQLRWCLNAGGILLLTGDYHVPRTRRIIQRATPRVSTMEVLGVHHALVQDALARLAPERRDALGRLIRHSSLTPLHQLHATWSERIALLALRLPGLDGLAADLVRGKVRPSLREITFPFLGSAKDCTPLPPEAVHMRR